MTLGEKQTYVQGSICVAGLHVVVLSPRQVVCWPATYVSILSMAVCYWGISQSQTTTQLAGNKHHYMKSSNTQGPLCIVFKMHFKLFQAIFDQVLSAVWGYTKKNMRQQF